jgi:hypothetical protein
MLLQSSVPLWILNQKYPVLILHGGSDARTKTLRTSLNECNKESNPYNVRLAFRLPTLLHRSATACGIYFDLVNYTAEMTNAFT